MDDMRPEYDLKSLQHKSTGRVAALLAEDPEPPVRLIRCYRCEVRLPGNVEGFEFERTEFGMICPACQEDVRFGYTDTIGRVEAVIKQQIRRSKIQSN